MDEFPGNSQIRRGPQKQVPAKSEPPDKKIEKVVTGQVLVRKPSMAKRIKTAFLGDESRNVKEYILLDVVIPSIKDTIVDAVTGGIERMILGENARPRNRGYRGPGASVQGHFNYNAVSSGPYQPPPRGMHADPRSRLSHRAEATHDFDEIIFPSRTDAEAVRAQMFDLLGEFDVVSVAEFLELAGITSNNFMNNKFGWVDLRGTGIHHTRGGYVLGLPPTQPID